MKRTAAILAAHGKRPAVWNEAVRTGAFTKACRVHGWESVKACLDATAKGYRTVVMPGAHRIAGGRQQKRDPDQEEFPATEHKHRQTQQQNGVGDLTGQRSGFREEQGGTRRIQQRRPNEYSGKSSHRRSESKAA